MKIIDNLNKIFFLGLIFSSLLFTSCDDEVEPETPESKSILAVDDSFEYSNEEWIDFTEWEEADIYYATYDIQKLLENDELLEGGSSNLQFELVSQPSFGTVNKSEQLLVFYFPNDDFNGEDSFEYQICKNGECSKAKVTIKVNGYQKPEGEETPDEEPTPVAEDILEFTNEEWFEKTNGEELSIYPKELNVYKSKFEGIDITKLGVISEPSFGSTKIYNDPSSWDFPYYISYYPNDDFDGEDSFEYEICKDDECYNGTITIRVEDFDKSTIHLSPDSFKYGYNEFNRNHTQIIMGEITATLSYEFSDFVSQDELGGLSFNDIELEVQQPSNGEVTVDSEGTINFVGEYSYEDARENGYEVTIEYSIKYEGKVYNSSIIVTVQKEDWGSGW